MKGNQVNDFIIYFDQLDADNVPANLKLVKAIDSYVFFKNCLVVNASVACAEANSKITTARANYVDIVMNAQVGDNDTMDDGKFKFDVIKSRAIANL